MIPQALLQVARRIADAGEARGTSRGYVLVKRGRRIRHPGGEAVILRARFVEGAELLGLLDRHHEPPFYPCFTVSKKGRRELAAAKRRRRDDVAA